MANLCFNISKGNRLILHSVLEEITSHVTSSSFLHVQQTPCNLRRQYIDGERNAMQCNVIERIFILFYLYFFLFGLYILPSLFYINKQENHLMYRIFPHRSMKYYMGFCTFLCHRWSPMFFQWVCL